jgi:hypothetical protein
MTDSITLVTIDPELAKIDGHMQTPILVAPAPGTNFGVDYAAYVLWPPPVGDAGASLNALMTAEKARSNGPRTIVQTAGTYTYTTQVVLQDDIDLLTHALSVNVSAIPTHAEVVDACFYGPYAIALLTATLASDVAVGDDHITVTPGATEISVGDKLSLVKQAFGHYVPFFVTRIDGSVVYVDRPFLEAFSHTTQGTITEYVAYPKNITIRGKGLFTGSGGSRFIEIVAGHECAIKDISVDDSQGFPALYGGFCCSFDNGGTNNLYDSVTLTCRTSDGAALNKIGLGLEGNSRSVIRNCTSIGSGTGATINDGTECVAENNTMSARGGSALVLSTAQVSAYDAGCVDCKIVGGVYGDTAGSTTYGILADQVATLTIDSVTVLHASEVQIALRSTIANSSVQLINAKLLIGSKRGILVNANNRLRIQGGTFAGAYVGGGGDAIMFATGSSGSADGLTASFDCTYGLFLQAEIPITACKISSSGMPIFWYATAGLLLVDRSELQTTSTYYAIGCAGGANSSTKLRDTKLVLAANTSGVDMTGATVGSSLTLEGVTTSGSAVNTKGVVGKTGCPVVVGGNNNLISCAVQYDANAIANATHVVTATGVV